MGTLRGNEWQTVAQARIANEPQLVFWQLRTLGEFPLQDSPTEDPRKLYVIAVDDTRYKPTGLERRVSNLSNPIIRYTSQPLSLADNNGKTVWKGVFKKIPASAPLVRLLAVVEISPPDDLLLCWLRLGSKGKSQPYKPDGGDMIISWPSLFGKDAK